MSTVKLDKLAACADLHSAEWLIQDGEFFLLEQMAFNVGQWLRIETLREFMLVMGY